jgi:cobalt-zinc-cadmium efflux system outer membrane protein
MVIHTRLLIMVLVIILTGLFFYGCVHFEAKPLDASDNLSRLEQRSLMDSGLRKFVETNLHRTFTEWPPNSLDFETLTLVALYFSHDLNVARAKSYEAEAAKIIAGENPNPSIAFSPGYNTSTPSGGGSPWILGLSFDIPIETFGKRGYRTSEAQHLSDAAKLAIAGTAWDVRTNLKKAMIALWQAREQELLAKEKLEAMDELVRISSARYKAGDIDKNELIAMQLLTQQAHLEYSGIKGRTAGILINLEGAAGLAPHALDGLNIDLSCLEQALPEIPSSSARRITLLNRADVLSSIAEYAAIESALRLEIAKQYPDLDISPGYEYDQGDNKWQLGFQLTLPLFNRNRGAIAEADARRNTASANFNALQAKVLNDIEYYITVFRNERDKLAGAVSALDNYKRQAELVQKQYKAGEVDKQAEISSRLEVINAASILLDSRIKTQESLADIEQTLQTPLNSSELPIASILMEVK